MKSDQPKPKRKRRPKLETELVKLDNQNSRPSGLAKTQRIIKTEKDKEQVFIKLCKKIKLDNYREERSINQRELRRAKR